MPLAVTQSESRRTLSALRICRCGAEISGRSDARYCSGRCKQKAYRLRIKGLDELESLGPYPTVVIDPPWPAPGYASEPLGEYDSRKGFQKDFDYPLLTLPEIRALPIPELLDSDSLVFLWTINRFTRQAFEILDAWKLRYMFIMAWCKPGGPKPSQYPMYNMESILVARKGSPRFLSTTNFKTANNWPRPRRSSAKPEEFYELLRRVTPAPRLDIFARRRIQGFDSFGNEAPW